MPEKRLNDELAAIEAALGSLRPAPSSVRRDRLMFLAGQASVQTTPRDRRRPAAWLWPCATSLSLLAAATFGVLWAAGNRSEAIERLANVPPKDSPAMFDFSPDVESPPSLLANRRLCQFVLKKGFDALPTPDTGSAPDRSAVPHQENNREMLNRFLKDTTI